MATEITQIDIQDFISQTYEGADISLLSQFEIDNTFTSNSYIEYFIYDNNKNILSTDYSFTEYIVLNDGQSAGNDNNLSQIEINPEQSLINSGYDQGEYITYFNILNKKIGSELQQLYIAEISSDRTEIRLDSTSLTNIDIVEQTNNFIQERDNNSYFLDFYINFGDNQLYIANNISLDNQDSTNPTILIKLYESLSDEFDINSTLWVVTFVEEPIAYKVTFEDIPIIFTDTTSISGPNFNLELKDQINNSSLELSYDDLIQTSLNSSTQQINSLLEEKEIDINVDYTNFNNFIHFSSAKARTENFYHKISLIEQYSSSIALIDSQITGSTSSSISVSSSKAIYESKINNIITNFDGYNYYLYYYSGSSAWPKTNTSPPYQLESTNSNAVLTWLGSDDETSAYYGGILLSASLYDNLNPNNLFYTIPEYLREDPANDPYQLFIEMVGQHYDNIWIYYKDVTQKYNADNRLENGISKDIVADAIRDFGIKLYQNNFSNEDLYTAFLGLTPEGGLFPFPNITGSLPTPSGYEYIDTKISASNDYLPLDDVNKSLYKRIYHNLPYLLQTKGTLPGLRALITSYGIPDTILRIKEYGGKDKVNTNDWDYWQNEFNYAYKQNGDNFISSSFVLNSSWGANSNNPETVMFRFKTNGLPTSSIPFSQSLFTTQTSLISPGNPLIALRYTGSSYTSGSYSGSIIDPYYQYAYLDFYPNSNPAFIPPWLTASVYLPFFDGEWWSVMVKRTGTGASTNFELYAGNKMYEGGENGTSIGFIASSSIIGNDAAFVASQEALFGYGTSGPPGLNMFNSFSGSFQEIRYYTKPISESVFRDFVMNPSSIEGNSINSGADQLAFRLPLGNELYTGSNSIHPKVTGSWITTSSFASNSTASFNSTPTFVSNTEYFYYDQPISGIKNAIADKIRVENNVIPEGDVLSPFMSLSQQANISQSYTANTNLLEVAFSPQDEVNDDINSSLGFFNIGEYIGDPRLRSSSAEFYPDLNALRDSYFQKYTKNYNLVDFVRLIKFFDNSLFKMIKDFVPARTSLASGIVIKQHILERNKYPQPQVDTNSIIAKYAKSGSIIWNEPIITKDLTISGTIAPQWNDYNAGTVENPNGGTAGTFEIFNGVNSSPYGPSGTGPENIFNLTQSWYETIPTPSGSISILHDAQDEFYDGEFEGSVIVATTQSLHQEFLNEIIDFSYTPVIYATNLFKGNNIILPATPSGILLNDPNFINESRDIFLNPLTVPDKGEILIFDNHIRSEFPITVPNSFSTQNFPYVKIHKIDHNNNNNGVALGQATRLRIEFPMLNEYRLIGDIIETIPFPTYYLYKVQKLDFIYFNEANNYIKDYSVSCSVTSSYSVGNGTPKTIINWNSSLPGTNLPHYGTPYFNTSSGIFTFENTPNIKLTLTASINTTGNGITSNFIQLIQIRNQTETVLSTSIYNSGGTNVLTTITSSLYPLLGDQYYIQLTKAALGVGITVNSAQLLLTQSNNWSISTSPTAPVSCSIIIEPYITEPSFFYNSDNNALLNSVNDQRENSFALDADYGYGTTPVNFNTLITGSATPATVPDSNYTSKKSTILKYDGSKSTSKLLNQWIEEDTGTYGKLPTVESLKTYIAYCDNDTFGGISGWPPEHENASAMFVKYLIKSDGTVVIPNTSKDSLSIIQQTFLTGERVIISSPEGTPVNPYRTIIRGGSHIEPILYTQSGSAPNAQFGGSILLQDVDLTNGGISANKSQTYASSETYYNSGNAYHYLDLPITPSNYPSPPNVAIVGGGNTYPSPSPPGYTVQSVTINEGVSLTITLSMDVQRSGSFSEIINNSFPIAGGGTLTFRLYKNSLSNANLINQIEVNLSAIDSTNSQFLLGSALPYIKPKFSTIIPNANLVVGDVYFGAFITNGSATIKTSGHKMEVTQYPIFPSPFSSTFPNTIWNWPSPGGHPYMIRSTNPQLVNNYGNPDVIMKSVDGSGFNQIQLPWDIKIGDEFRFEGREDWSYMVKNIYAPTDSGSGRISQTGSIEVHFNENLPISASTTVFNLDHFLIRRYVDDAAQNVITGFRPQGSTGPYLIKPEFVVPELNKSIDEVILDLTQKGLIT
jgi:hypothetical protein